MNRYNTRPLKDVVGALLGKLEKGAAKKGSAAIAAWQSVAGEGANNHSVPISFKKGILTVIVENSSWLYQLTFNKKNILKKFNEKYEGRKKAEDIKFRVGVVEEDLL